MAAWNLGLGTLSFAFAILLFSVTDGLVEFPVLAAFTIPLGYYKVVGFLSLLMSALLLVGTLFEGFGGWVRRLIDDDLETGRRPLVTAFRWLMLLLVFFSGWIGGWNKLPGGFTKELVFWFGLVWLGLISTWPIWMPGGMFRTLLNRSGLGGAKPQRGEQAVTIRVFAALYEEAKEGWVWISPQLKSDSGYIKIQNRSYRRSIVVEQRIIDENFVAQYNVRERTLKLTLDGYAVVMNQYYRQKLIVTPGECQITITATKNPWNMWIRSPLQHPSAPIRVATILGLLSVVLGCTGLVVGSLALLIAQ